MQVKFDKFLALTAMLASAQLSTACVVKEDDTTDSTDTTDTGDAEDSGATSTDPTSESEDEQDAGQTNGSTSVFPGVDAALVLDAGVFDAQARGDAAVDAEAEADGGEWVDGGDAGGDVGPDAGGEGDPSTESAPDAGGEGDVCDLGDFADESFALNCAGLNDSCAETGYNGVADLCFSHYYNKRADVAQAFWDCYAEQDLGDPCNEVAESAAYACADAADESICLTAVGDCSQVTTICDSADQAFCETHLASYNSGYIQAVVACVTAKADGQDPGYEGCDYDFMACVNSPSAE